MVAEFFKRAKEENEDHYNEVCEKYPTLSTHKWRSIQQRECTFGLVGLHPTPLPIDVAEENNLESTYMYERENE